MILVIQPKIALKLFSVFWKIPWKYIQIWLNVKLEVKNITLCKGYNQNINMNCVVFKNVLTSDKIEINW